MQIYLESDDQRHRVKWLGSLPLNYRQQITQSLQGGQKSYSATIKLPYQKATLSPAPNDLIDSKEQLQCK